MQPPPPLFESARPAISLVATLYRSGAFLPRFLDECQAALQVSAGDDFEIVLVNDGSPDDSLAYALSRRADIPGLVVVDLSRNFGHHAAIQAGLSVARGAYVWLIDADLEVAPAVLPQMQAKLLSSGADLVFGYQERRKGGWFEQASGALFWRLLNRLSDTAVPENVLTERVMSRRFVQSLLSLGDRNLFLGGMMSWTGYVQIGMPVAKRQREGASTYTVSKRLQLMTTAVSSFSAKPLTAMFPAGLTITALAFGYALYLVLRKLIWGDALLGFTSLMALGALSLGVLTTGLGLLGIYLGKVYTQVQARPTFIIRDLHR